MRMIYADHSNDTVYICRSMQTNLTCLEHEYIKVWFAELTADAMGICPETAADIVRIVSGRNCPTRSVLWEVRNLCDGKQHCSLASSAVESDDPCDGLAGLSILLRLEYGCYNNARRFFSNEMLYRWLLVAISSMFLLLLASLLVSIRRVRTLSRLSTSSSQAPLTQLDNREV